MSMKQLDAMQVLLFSSIIGYLELRPEAPQRSAILEGNDVFIALPTGNIHFTTAIGSICMVLFIIKGSKACLAVCNFGCLDRQINE